VVFALQKAYELEGVEGMGKEVILERLLEMIDFTMRPA
jgi:hypothetical protein